MDINLVRLRHMADLCGQSNIPLALVADFSEAVFAAVCGRGVERQAISSVACDLYIVHANAIESAFDADEGRVSIA